MRPQFGRSSRAAWAGVILASMLLVACDGDDGTDGAAGAAGADGSDGAAGADGVNALVETAEASQAECPNGGTAINSGQDVNGNGTLDEGEIASTEYVCSGAGGEADAPVEAATADNFKFVELGIPTTPEEKAATRASQRVTIDETTYEVDYHELYTSTQELPLLGGADGETVIWGAWTKNDGSNFLMEDGSPRVSNKGSGPDFTSLLTYEEAGETSIFAVTNLESSNGGVYISKLDQDPANGLLSTVATRPVDFSDEFGTYVNCAGMVTPWGTHLSSEEYEPPMPVLDEDAAPYGPDSTPGWADGNSNMEWFGAASWHDEHMLAIAMYNDLENTIAEDNSTAQAVGAKTFGYYYGWTPEVTITGHNGEHEVTKHYSMGRFAHELAYVMPDEKTVYLSDDGANTGLFMFIADEARDLSAGTLYAAQWNQTSGSGLGEADIEWVNLGHASNGDIKPALMETSPTDEGITFDDMFATAERNADGSCPAGFTSTNTYDVGPLCTQLKTGDFDVDGDGTGDVSIDTLASRLESRLYAAMKGATTEFRKEEGITFDPFGSVLYVAMSEVARGMMDGFSFEKGDNRYDFGGANHIRLNRPNLCGAVYGMDVVDATKGGYATEDTDGSSIETEYLAKNMYGVIGGRDNGDPTKDDTCALGAIANPDNIAFLPAYGELVIGEDGNHNNNMIWSYDVVREDLVRFLTVPEGAETTSPYWHVNVNGWGYFTAVAQHPGDSDTSIGYVGPFPPLDESAF